MVWNCVANFDWNGRIYSTVFYWTWCAHQEALPLFTQQARFVKRLEEPVKFTIFSTKSTAQQYKNSTKTAQKIQNSIQTVQNSTKQHKTHSCGIASPPALLPSPTSPATVPTPGNTNRNIRPKSGINQGINCRDSVPVHIPQSRYLRKHPGRRWWCSHGRVCLQSERSINHRHVYTKHTASTKIYQSPACIYEARTASNTHRS